MDSITPRRTAVKTPSVLEIGSLEVTREPLIRRKAHLKVAEVRKGIKVKEKGAVATSRKAEESQERGEAKVANKEAGAVNKVASKEAGSRLNKITMVRIGTNGIPLTSGQLETKPISSGTLGSSWIHPPRTDPGKETVRVATRRVAKVEEIRTKCLPVVSGAATPGKIIPIASTAMVRASL